ncbi:hypothetical protein [uncultured Desulfobacter sp.]|uniref:hypothetical protein n=1 Tax=uncultured Desulfobacter sp. TaxID=240139 RepID=UPI002AA7345C|nr:hypothetical protein [uncultured Desulfobacter sp.]
MMKSLPLIFTALLLLSLFWQPINDAFFNDRNARQAVQALIEEVKKKHNIAISVGPLPANIYDKTLSGKAPEPKHAHAALVELDRALGEYPEDLLVRVLDRVLIVGNLTISGFRVGGTYQFTNGKTSIIIATDYDFSTENKTFVRRAFHHELSSILITRFPFQKEQWQSLWPDDIRLPTAHNEILQYSQQYASPQEIETLYEKGFVSDYGLAGVENDINTYAELLMDAPARMAVLANRSPTIRKKLHILLLFYSELHPAIKKKIENGSLVGFLSTP